MIDTTEITPEKLEKVKEYISSLGLLTLEQTPWELILWDGASMRVICKSPYWSDILEIINFKEYIGDSSC